MRRQNWLLVVRDSHASQFVARRIGPHMHRDAMSYILRQDVSKSMGEWLETGPSGGRFILGQHGRVARPSRRAGGFRRNERPRHSRSWQDDLSPILWRRAPPICNRLSSRTEPGVPRSVDECTGRDLLSLRDPAGAIARSRATRACEPGHPDATRTGGPSAHRISSGPLPARPAGERDAGTPPSVAPTAKRLHRRRRLRDCRCRISRLVMQRPLGLK